MKAREPNRRAEAIFAQSLFTERQKTDRLFFWLLVGQWLFAILVALVFSPYAWAGKLRTPHFHVQVAFFIGAALNALPLALIHYRPGWWVTRHSVAMAQMLWSALLIHLSGGRIETHFHVFGSLAFVAFYRDWKVLLTATVVVATEHFARGLLWPESVYGLANPEWWRFLEHAFWVVFEDIILVLWCARSVKETKTLAEREASLESTNARVEQEVVARTTELNGTVAKLRGLVESTNAIPWEYDLSTGRLTYISPQAVNVLGHKVEVLVDNPDVWDLVHADDRERVKAHLTEIGTQSTDAQLVGHIDYRSIAADGRIVDIRSFMSRGDDSAQGTPTVRGYSFDITSQKKLEMELGQAQKLESVGRLAAGVAHEINTPVQFVSDSVHFARESMKDVSALVDAYQAVCRAAGEDGPASVAAKEATRIEEEVDLPYILENVPKALDRSLEGLSRVATIVKSMKEFAHPDQKEKALVDLNRAIQSTLTIARNEYKYVADVETTFGELPPVLCHAGEINQAILNIVVNAAHAIEQVVRGTDRKGLITIQTRRDGDSAVVAIGDTGGGIPDAIRSRVFDPFFTTKEVGKGTGQGLSIARSVVVEKHGGDLTLETELGKGTTFFLRLPLQQVPESAAAAQ